MIRTIFFSVILFCFSTFAYSQEYKGKLKITAFVAAYSDDKNEFGDRSDWVELTNISDQTILVPQYALFLTDQGGKRPFRFELPEHELTPGQTWRIYCDGENVFANEAHTNFKLSKRGEHIALYLRSTSGETVLIDEWIYDALNRESRGLRKNQSGLISVISR